MSEELIFRPDEHQLAKDFKKEAMVYFLIAVAAAAFFISVKRPEYLVLVPIGFAVTYYRFSKFRRSLSDRFIMVKDGVLFQERPHLPDLLKTIDLQEYEKAVLSGKYLSFRLPKQEISLQMKVSLAAIDLTGYPEREAILAAVNDHITGSQEAGTQRGVNSSKQM